MNLNRPDLSQVAPDIRSYIEALEAELDRLRGQASRPMQREPSLEPSEPPTTINVITVSKSGLAKRTPRHLYARQRRAGMGIFDLETPEDDPPAHLVVADEAHDLLIITDQARVFRLPVSDLPESPVRSRGQNLNERLPLHPGETIAIILPRQTQGYLVLVSQTGQVRRLRHHLFRELLGPGTAVYDIREIGPPAVGCWTSGEDELFIASRQGRAIRFGEQQVPTKGCLGLRLNPDDAVVAVTGVRPESGVFLLSADGKGIIREMSGFSPNKAPGSGGKAALKTDHLAGALAVAPEADLFIISRLSKIIRFQAAEVSTTEGVVQGVHCIGLRSDEVVTVSGSEPGS